MKRLMVIVLFLLVLLAGAAFAQTLNLDPIHSGKAEMLCNAAEKLIFGCDTQTGGQISLCQSKVLNKHSGYVKFRQGSPGAIQTEFPSDNTKPQKIFTFARSARFQSEKTYIRFSVGQTPYELFMEDYVTHGNRIVQNGLRINPGPSQTQHQCSGKPTGTLRHLEGKIQESK